MPKTIVKKIISRGLQEILTQRLNADFTAYDGNPVVWQGDTAFVFTPQQTITELPSGNDPMWDVIKGPVTGEVEVTLYDFPLDIMPELFGVRYDAEQGVCVGENDEETLFIGISFDRIVKEDNVQSRNKAIIHKVYFELPAIDTKTISRDDNAVGELKLKGKASPLFYPKADGTFGSRTYALVNSVKNKAKYDANKDCIVFPEEFTANS